MRLPHINQFLELLIYSAKINNELENPTIFLFQEGVHRMLGS